MRILWMSNSPWTATGYGAQTRRMLPLLKDLGHEVACFGYWGLDGGCIEWEGFRCYPPLLDQWGNDAVEGHMRDWEADCLITLFDPFVCDSDVYQRVGHKWLPWVPIDSHGLAEGLQVLRYSRLIATLSQHGTQELEKAGFPSNNLMLIPHGVDTNLFFNRTEEERKECRREFELPENGFIVGMIQANKGGRKSIELQIEAFARFREQAHADDAHLYIHTEPTTCMGGVDLEDCVKRSGLSNKGVVTRTGDYHYRRSLPEDKVARLYGCFDVLLQATSGEGFGLPIIEAQASGVPVVVNGCSAMPELVAVPGLVCRDPAPFRAPHGGWHFVPRVEEIVRCLKTAYKWSWNSVTEHRQECATFAQQFDWANIASRWQAVLSVYDVDRRQGWRPLPISNLPAL